MADPAEPTKLTARFAAALAEVFRLHRDHERKGSGVPYLGHLLATAGSVLHFGGDENQAIGALLHDAAEDCGGRARVDSIREKFDDDVAAIVEGCSDTPAISARPGFRRDERQLRLREADPAGFAAFLESG